MKAIIYNPVVIVVGSFLALGAVEYVLAAFGL